MSRLVKKVGEQQRDLILEFSQQINQHNELISKAMEKQDKMETKLDRIEHKIMEKEIYNYQLIQMRLERKKEEDRQRRKSVNIQAIAGSSGTPKRTTIEEETKGKIRER